MPRASHPVVHPAPVVELAQAQGQGPALAPGAAAGVNAPPPAVLMVDRPWAPGTRWGLGTHLVQALLAAAAISFMASTDDFHEITAFRHLVVAAGLQCAWCVALAFVDVYALLVKRSLRAPALTCVFSFGELAIGTLIFIPACGSAAIVVLINDEKMCSENHCQSFRAATSMAFLSWMAIMLSGLLNLWTAVYRVQRARVAD